MAQKTIGDQEEDNFMHHYKRSLLCLLLMFFVFTLFSCTNTKHNETEVTTTEATTEITTITLAPGSYIGGPGVEIVTYEELDLNDFLDSPDLDAEENERFKRIVTDSILYIYGLDVDFDDILAVVDVQASREWYARVMGGWIEQAPEEREGWTIVDDIRSHRAHREEWVFEILSIQTNFMLRSGFWSDEFFVEVPIFWRDGGYAIYSFSFVEVDGELKLVGLVLGG